MERIYAVMGLGYVGLELAVALADSFKVKGFDISAERIEQLNQAYDKNKIIDKERLENVSIEYTARLLDIKPANFYIVAIPTPVYYYELPNLEYLIEATTALAGILKKGDVWI